MATVTASGILESQISTIVGASVRIVVEDAHGAIKHLDHPEVSGVAERTIVGSVSLASQASSISGVSENSVVGSASIVSGDSTVVGTSNKKYSYSFAIQPQSSSILALSENEVTSSPIQIQGDASLVVGSADRGPTVASIELSSAESQIVGSGFFKHTSSGAITTEITFAGIASRGLPDVTIVLESSDATLTSSTGLTRNLLTGTIESQNSSSSGAGVRSSIANGTLVSGQSVVTGLSENEIGGSGTLTTGDVTVTFNVERTVSAGAVVIEMGEITFTTSATRESNATGSLDTGSSSVTGAGINGSNATGALTTGSSIVSGVAEDEHIATGSLVVTDASVVAGLGERGLNIVDGALTAAEVGVSAVTGAAENIIVESDATLDSGPSTLTGLAERGSNSIDGTLESAVSEVTGSVERSVTSISGTLTAGISNFTGDAEREEIANPVTLKGGDASATGAATLSHVGSVSITTSITFAGIAERVMVSNDIEVTNPDSTISGVAERISTTDVVIVSTQSTTTGLAIRYVDNRPIGQSVESGQSSIVATTDKISNLLETEIISEDADADGAGFRTANGTGVLVSGQSNTLGVSENIVVSSPVSLEAQSSTVSGTGAKGLVITDNVSGGDATVVGDGDRESSSFGLLLGGPSSISGVGATGRHASGVLVHDRDPRVGGISEREITGIDTALTSAEVGVSGVIGVAENIVVVADGSMESDPSTFSGVAERTVIVEPVSLESQSSTTSNTGIRKINSFSAILVSGQSAVTGVSENIITGTGSLTTDASVISGTGDRESNATGSLVVTDVSVVAGLGERTINTLNGALTADEVGVSAVTGAAENIIVDDHTDVKSDPSTVVGSGVRHANSLDGTLESASSEVDGAGFRTANGTGVLVSAQSTISGTAENIIDQEGGGDFKASDVVIVGAGVRTANLLEGEISAEEIGLSGVTGISERELIEDAVLLSQDATVDGQGARHANGSGVLVQSRDSRVGGIAEREINVTGIEQSGDASATGVSTRTVVNVPNYGVVGDLVAFGPDDNGPSLTYIDDYTVQYTGTAQRYNVLDGVKSFTLSVNGDNLVVTQTHNTIAKDYNLYWRDKGTVVAPELRWDVIFFNTTAGRWYQEEFEQHPAEWYNGQVLEEYTALNTVETTSIDALRDGDASSRVYSSEAFIAAISENIIPVNKAFLKAQDADLTSTIKRTLPATSLDYQAPDVIVQGLGERILNRDGLGQQLVTTPSIVTGLGERTLNRDGVNQELVAQPSTIVGVAERIVNRDGLGQVLFSGQSSVTATTARELKPIDSTDGIAQVDDATVTGTAERKSVGDGALVSAQSAVTGIAERVLNNDGVNHTLISGPSSVVGVAERITTSADNELVSDDATLSGVAEREINLLEGIGAATDMYYAPSTAEGYVSYAGNNVVVSGLSGGVNGTYVPTPQRFIAGFDISANRYEYVTESDYGTFERDNGDGTFDILLWSPQINYWAIFDSETTSIYNVVAGDNLRDISPNACAQTTIQVEFRGTSTTPSIVTGVAERTLNNDGLGQSVESGSSEVIGSGVRTSNRLPDFLGPLAISPNSDDSNISYSGRDLVVSGLLGHLALFNGTYQQNPVASCFTESGNNHIYHVDEFSDTDDIANWYISKTDAYGGYLFTFYDKTQSKWFISFTSDNPYEWQDGHVTNGTNSLKTEVAYASELRPSGFKSQQGDASTVVGVAERFLDNRPIGQEVQSGPASVVGVSVRNAKPIDGDTNSDDSKVDGIGKIHRLPIVADLKSGDSKAYGVSENIIIQTQKPNLKGGPIVFTAVVKITSNGVGVLLSGPSIVSGVAENQIDQEIVPSEFKADDSKIVGIAERKIKGSGDFKIRLPFLSQKGQAERVIVTIEATLKGGDSKTDSGVGGEREIHNIVDPDLGETRLYSGNNRPWQIAGKTYPSQPDSPITMEVKEEGDTVRPRVGGDMNDPSHPIVNQTVGFQEAIPIYQTILVRAPRKRTK